MTELDPEILKEIQKHFENIKSNLEMDEVVDSNQDLEEELQDLLGLSEQDMNELDREVMDMMRRQVVNVELIHEDAVFPSYAYPTDSGFDLHSVDELTIPPLGRALVSTGIKLSFDIGYEVQIRPKSGLALKQGLTVLNTPGTVDAGYTGEIKVIIFNTTQVEVYIPKGMKIAQAVVCPVMNGNFIHLNQVEKVENKDRGENGFGSTGI